MTEQNAALFQGEVDRVRTVYAELHQKQYAKTIWSPFDETQAAYLAQLRLSFSRLLREAGYGDLAGLRILDYGCSRGRALRSLMDMGALPEDLYGVDVDEKSITLARSLSPNINYSLCSGWSLDFADASFDLVMQYVVFSSIGLPGLRERLAGELTRVLKPGGHIFWWDMPTTVKSAGSDSLHVARLFPGMPIRELHVGMYPLPSACLRPLRGLRRILRPLLDKLGHPPTHVAAIIGPKA